MLLRSQTHCSPLHKRSMICKRVSSANAWNRRAACSALFEIRDGMQSIYQMVLICQMLGCIEMGIRGRVARSTHADANETSDWRICADFEIGRASCRERV